MAVRVETFNGIRRIGDSRDILVDQWELENEVIQILKPMYRSAQDYFMENGWEHPLSGDDIYEDLYWERWGPAPEHLKEQWIWWRMKKDVNDYIRFLILFDWQTLFVKTDQKLLYRGKKPKGAVERINLILKVKLYLQFDIDDKFKNSIAWQMRKAFFNRIYIQEMEQQKHELLDFSMKLKLFMKGLMSLEREGEWPANQYGKLGYGDWGDEDINVS